MKKGPPPEEKGETAPIWIISFADMISLLMAFFIMLLTMASGKSGKLCSEGYKFDRTLFGFRQNIASYGLIGLTGNPDDSLSFDTPRNTYNVSDGDANSSIRSLDAEKERIQRIFDQLERVARAQPSALQGKKPQFSITPITFDSKKTALNEPAKLYLAKFVTDLQEAQSKDLTLYVVGLAPDISNAKKQWILAGQRANAAADYIKSALPHDSKISVYSWGCKKIDDLAGLSGKSAQQSCILIGTLQPDSSQ